MLNVREHLQIWQTRIEQVLAQVLPADHINPQRLHAAMRYSVLNGGKRMRPLLVYATGEALGIQPSVLDIPAAAIELVHVYSLVHDEATAILVGDGLQALAFQLLAAHPDLAIPAEQRLKIIELLAQSASSRGMVGGQAIDLASVGKTLTEVELENMHIHKTGALIRASVLAAAYTAHSISTEQLHALDHYAKCVGLAFQVQDDILDIESETHVLGKTQGADKALDKPTYPAIIGMAASKAKLQLLYDEAIEALSSFGESAQLLREIAEFTVKRLR